MQPAPRGLSLSRTLQRHRLIDCLAADTRLAGASVHPAQGLHGTSSCLEMTPCLLRDAPDPTRRQEQSEINLADFPSTHVQ